MKTSTRVGERFVIRVVDGFFSIISPEKRPNLVEYKSDATLFEDRETAEEFVEIYQLALASIEPATGWIVRIDQPSFHYGKGFDGFYSTYVEQVGSNGYAVSCDRDRAYCFETEIDALTFILRHRLVRAFVEDADGGEWE
jgi:hypothetical protein